MKLIDNWQQAWRFWSFRLAVIIPLVNAILYFLPKIGVGPGWMVVINAVIGVAIAFARVVKQKNISGE